MNIVIVLKFDLYLCMIVGINDHSSSWGWIMKWMDTRDLEKYMQFYYKIFCISVHHSIFDWHNPYLFTIIPFLCHVCSVFHIQASGKGLSKMSAPPLPSKTKSFTSSGPPTFSKPLYSTGTFPGKVKAIGVHLRPPELHSSHSNTLPLPNKQESPPAAAVRPYSPDLSDVPPPVLQKPQTLAASSIYSMYTQRATPGKGYQLGGQGTLSRSQTRGNALIQMQLLLLFFKKFKYSPKDY